MRIRRVQKKPVIVNAFQFDGTEQSLEFCKKWLGKAFVGSRDRYIFNTPEESNEPVLKQFNIATLEGLHYAIPGDWIIQGVKGEFYPCKPDIFDQTYTVLKDELDQNVGLNTTKEIK